MSGPSVSAPLVSVVIPVFNGAAYIEKAVTSALRQTLDSLEVIVADNGSTDRTPDLVRAMAARDARVRLVECRGDRSPGAARNRAIDCAFGSWIALLDADDWYRHDRLERLLQAPFVDSADLISDEIVLVDEADGTEGMRGGAATAPTDITAARFIVGSMPNPRAPRSHNLGFLKPVFRAAFLRAHELLYREDLRLGEDYALYLECLLNGARWRHLPEASYFYLVRARSLTATHDSADLARFCHVDEMLLAADRPFDETVTRLLEAHLLSSQKRMQWARFVEHWKAGKFAEMTRCMAFSRPVFRHLVVQGALHAMRKYGRRLTGRGLRQQAG